MLTAMLRRHWEDSGYLILPGFFTADDVEPINDLVDALYHAPPRYLVVDSTRHRKRCRLIDTTPDERAERNFKLNDLYLNEPLVRNLALHPRLVPVLNELLGDPAVLCNSLNFEKGSGQPKHIDSLFMTPRTPRALVATWVALEDAHPDAGQLFYYPGSHTLPLFTFADGSHHAGPGELPAWDAYMDDQLARRELQPERFAARRGDVLIWHSDLVHGGSTIHDANRTRKSLVSHYFTLTDSRALGSRCVRSGAGYWVRRNHPPLEGDRPTWGERVRAMVRRLTVVRAVRGVVARR
jgi:phytanoyl-CoA hydroxylase